MTADRQRQVAEVIEEWRLGRLPQKAPSAESLAAALAPLIKQWRERDRAEGAVEAEWKRSPYVWIDPARRSGEPCIGGHRLPVELLIGTVWADGVDAAMRAWSLTRAEVLAACWYAGAGYPVRLHNSRSEYRPRRGPWAKRWGTWAAEVHQALWEVSTVDYEAIPDPPRSAVLREGLQENHAD